MHTPLIIRKNLGFTLIEVLIIVSIIAILTIILKSSTSQQINKADDSEAKSDLYRLKIAFEEYYTDHSCYPPAEWFDSPADCGSNHLTPYLAQIPCDKNTSFPYVLETDDTTCNWFKLYATLSLPGNDEQAISQRSPSGSTKGNYGVSSTNTLVTVYYDPASEPPTPPASSNPTNLYYYCSSLGNCTSKPASLTCSPTYTNDPYCGNQNSPCENVISTCQQ